jgi:hypothetical protein
MEVWDFVTTSPQRCPESRFSLSFASGFSNAGAYSLGRVTQQAGRILPHIFEILTTIGFLSTIGLLALAVVGLWYAIEEWQFRRRVGRACDKALDEDPSSAPIATNQTPSLPAETWDGVAQLEGCREGE